ncbi:MAG TPA: sugar-binding domain-containing protein [Blastocatellia bacterium]|nr:sugar-binding domain-containing protein [Blastocatellia bacterium]
MPAKHQGRELESLEIMEKAARMYFIERHSQEYIATKLQVKGGGPAISKILDKAREQGVIAFDIDRSYGIVGTQEPNLRRQLREKFEIHEAIVVGVDELTMDERLSDDYLHTALANQTGAHVAARIQPNDHVGIGSGRAVYQAVKAIKRMPPLRRGVRITPISGRIWTHSWKVDGSKIERPLDADDAAFVLSLAFENEPGTRFSQVAYPLFVSSQQEAAEIMNTGCPFLPGAKWRFGIPKLALVGVGTVDPRSGHRFADLYRSDKNIPELDRYLDLASIELKAAIEFVQAAGLPHFSDITNRLFPTLPFPHEVEKPVLKKYTTAYNDLIRKLNRLNERMVVVEFNHLREIQSVVAIAGGPFKIRALWTLLITALIDPSKRILTELTTDAESARTLMATLEAYNVADLEIKTWYEAMTKTLF